MDGASIPWNFRNITTCLGLLLKDGPADSWSRLGDAKATHGRKPKSISSSTVGEEIGRGFTFKNEGHQFEDPAHRVGFSLVDRIQFAVRYWGGNQGRD